MLPSSCLSPCILLCLCLILPVRAALHSGTFASTVLPNRTHARSAHPNTTDGFQVVNRPDTSSLFAARTVGRRLDAQTHPLIKNQESPHRACVRVCLDIQRTQPTTQHGFVVRQPEAKTRKIERRQAVEVATIRVVKPSLLHDIAKHKLLCF